MTKTDYRFVSAHVDNLDDGQTVEPGQKISLDDAAAKQPHAARMIDDGLLLEIKPAATKQGAARKEGE